MQKYHCQSENAKRNEAIEYAHESLDTTRFVSARDEKILAAFEMADVGADYYGMSRRIFGLVDTLDGGPEAMRRLLELIRRHDMFGGFLAMHEKEATDAIGSALQSERLDCESFSEFFHRYAWTKMYREDRESLLRQDPLIEKFQEGLERLIRGEHPEEVGWILEVIFRESDTRDTERLYEYTPSVEPVLARILVDGLEDADKKRLAATLVEEEDFYERIAPYRGLFTDDEFARLFTAADVHGIQRLLAPSSQYGGRRNVDEDDLRVASFRFDAVVRSDIAALDDDQLGILIDAAYSLHRQLSTSDLEGKGVERARVRNVIKRVFTTYLDERDTGDALRFAWSYPDLNIRNVPAALNASGLDFEKWIPDEVFHYAASTVRGGNDLEIAVVAARKTHGLTPGEFLKMREFRPEALEFVKDGPNAEMIMRELADTEKYGEDENIRNGMQTMRDIFGAEVTLRYANRVGLSRHDAFHFASDIAAFVRTSGIPAKEIGRVLLEVAKDDALYGGNSAHAELMFIMKVFAQTTMERVLSEARAFTSIEELQKLVRDIDANPRLSWKRLKKICDVEQFLRKRELLEELSHGDVPPKLRAYVMKLAFHENIAMDKVLEFWKKPHAFLEIDDAHTSEEINASKKPSNYLSLPFLGMHAEDLRDALVEGSIDRLQTLPPMERNYRIRAGEVVTPDALAAERAARRGPVALHGLLVDAIGMERKNVPGKARDPRRVFGRTKAFFKERGIAWEQVWNAESGIDVLAKMSAEDHDALLAIIDDAEFGLPQKNLGDEYRMVLGNKSDPDMVIAGNDTASCMPFGSGKNNVYMYNPNCVQLVLQRKTGDGVWRTAAQSVVTIDVETGRPTPELIAAYKAEARLKDLVDVERLVHPGVVTCDNIEIAKNQEGERSVNIAKIYTQFWKDYLAENADALRVDAARVIVGTGYTPGALGLPSIDNTFVPLAPMGYSDNVHEQAFEIRTGLVSKDAAPQTGVTRMTTRDVLAIAVLEGKAYHDNVSLLENLHGMQNNIIGMEIANAHFSRPDLSFVYRDEAGKPRGYMLAYEGRNGKKPEIFIADLAADLQSKLAGGRLITQFFDAYRTHYGTSERPYLPIFTNARDQTSYKIIQSQFTRFLDRAGLVGEVVELASYQRGPDTIHDVRMFIGKTREDVERQKREYAKPVPASSDDGFDFGTPSSWDDL